MKHISSRGPYLSSRKAAKSAALLSHCKSRSSLHLRNDSPMFILVFSLARSNSFFLLCFSSSVFSSLWCGQWRGVCPPLLLSGLCHCIQFGLECTWPGKSRHCVGEGLPAAYAQAWLSLLRHSPWLWLVELIREQWILRIKLQPLGGPTASGFLHSWPVSYCTVRS